MSTTTYLHDDMIDAIQADKEGAALQLRTKNQPGAQWLDIPGNGDIDQKFNFAFFDWRRKP